jgi:penicillin amidase
MYSRLKHVIGISIVILAFLITLSGVAYYLTTKSFPKTEGEYELSGLNSEVKIYRDAYGVPHIYATNERDAYIAVGFVHAQDRLWQMELYRRAGLGTLAEELGEKLIPVDKMFRILNLRGIADQTIRLLPAETREALEAYCEGVNLFITGHKGSYPIEFDILGIEPQPWKVEHTLLISRLMAWELNMARFSDLVLQELIERFGEAKARELLPLYPENGPLIMPREFEGKKIAALGREFFKADQLLRTIFGHSGYEGGSNAWAVSGKHTYSGKPLLANDPHLLLGAPARWYELHVSCPSLDVAGMTIAGVPFVVVGRNRSIAWGVTNVMVDDLDFYVEEVDALPNPTLYRLNGVYVPLKKIEDTIYVNNAPPEPFVIYSTHRGPIINSIEKPAMFTKSLLSARWVGSDPSDEATAFYRIDHASSWEEFTNALKTFATPAQNFVYADINNVIGYRMGGRIPLRPTNSGILPFPGTTTAYDWKGYVPFEKMPVRLNPRDGYVVSANNKIVDAKYPYYITNTWESPYRAQRITDLVSEKEKIAPEDFQRIQQDLVSYHAKEIVPYIIKAVEGRKNISSEVQIALNYFRNWNYEMRPENVTTSIFNAFFVKLVENTLADELGPELLSLYDTLTIRPIMVMSQLLRKGNSVWFDNIKTDSVETADSIIYRSLEDGLQLLHRQTGQDLKAWQWGAVHQIEFKHVFGEHPLLARIFNRGPYPIGGAYSTVAKGDYFLSEPFKDRIGPSSRQIFDLSDVNNGRACTPPGQSGQPFHKHYDDQITLWLYGGYRRMLFDPTETDMAKYQLLILRPVR